MTLLCVVLGAVTIIQVYFWVGQLDIVNRQKSRTAQDDGDPLPVVTLIIAAKNEAENLSNNLSLWAAQDYPSLEIIIVDDHSSDATWKVLQGHRHDRLQIFQLPEGSKGKKAALAFGISQSKGDWVVTTDADCQPNSNLWITALMKKAHQSDLIIGYSPYRRTSNWVGALVSYESWYVALQYISALLLRRPYMSVGRNVAFRRNLYQSVSGYSAHDHIMSGDDDLFLQSVKSKSRISHVILRDSWVWTTPPENWQAYLRQKRRHISTAPHYGWSDQLILITAYASQVLFYALIIILSFEYPLVLLLLFFRYLAICFVAYRSQHQLFLPVKWWLAPIYDTLLCLFYLILTPLISRAPKRWS